LLDPVVQHGDLALEFLQSSADRSRVGLVVGQQSLDLHEPDGAVEELAALLFRCGSPRSSLRPGEFAPLGELLEHTEGGLRG